MRIINLVEDFVRYVKKNNVPIYNEASIQYELAIFLRRKIKNYKIQLERNVSAFGLDKTKTKFSKKEIDVCIFRGDEPKKSTEKHAIEIKFPINGEYPAQMFSFCKDIRFLEELKAAGFQNNLFVAFTNDHLFWEGPKTDGVYKPFRQSGKLEGVVKDPFYNEDIKFENKYYFKWQDGFKDEYGELVRFFTVIL
jgi:hypothetical protein